MSKCWTYTVKDLSLSCFFQASAGIRFGPFLPTSSSPLRVVLVRNRSVRPLRREVLAGNLPGRIFVVAIFSFFFVFGMIDDICSGRFHTAVHAAVSA